MTSRQLLFRRTFRIVAAILLILLILGLGYAGYAYYAYNRVLPADRACVDCATPIHVNGFDLYYRAVGADRGSPPVVLVHGGPGHSSLSFKNSFDFLADQTRVIYYDQRGSGNSQIKPDPSAYTVEQLVAELETLRRDVLEADKIILIGHSFGSAVTQRYALAYPEHVSKMILTGGTPINNNMGSAPVWKWFGPLLYSTALGFPPADARAADAWFTLSADADNATRLFDPTRTDLFENTGTASFAPWREISLSVAGDDYRAELARLNVPTLFIYGVADSPYTGKPVADELCARVPHCTAVEFEKSGHWAFLEEPEKFQQVVREFISPP